MIWWQAAALLWIGLILGWAVYLVRRLDRGEKAIRQIERERNQARADEQERINIAWSKARPGAPPNRLLHDGEMFQFHEGQWKRGSW